MYPSPAKEFCLRNSVKDFFRTGSSVILPLASDLQFYFHTGSEPDEEKKFRKSPLNLFKFLSFYGKKKTQINCWHTGHCLSEPEYRTRRQNVV